ncbi:MAG TPA: DNA starvation/stationary phase protection protein [Ktedonobacterales bacterium]|nr:DNA starvation/stationary phase protection protein [Ktedonobacterales bacterium]
MTTQTTHHTTRTQTNGHVKTYPAAKQLATKTDLTAQETQAITEALNPLIADAFALYVKTKNFHWHLSGSHFRDYHLLFDEHAEAIFSSIDILAERVRRVGGTTIRSISHISELQTIEDDNNEFVTPGQMARRLMDDNAHIAKMQRAAHEVCDKNRDYATASELEVIIDQTERRTWFLFEVCQGMDNAD